jgi:hypothetical protein
MEWRYIRSIKLLKPKAIGREHGRANGSMIEMVYAFL